MAAAAGNADERACHAGLITVPANKRHGRELAYILQHSAECASDQRAD